MIKNLFSIDVIVVIQTKGIPDNVGNLHPGINEKNLHNLISSMMKVISMMMIYSTWNKGMVKRMMVGL